MLLLKLFALWLVASVLAENDLEGGMVSEIVKLTLEEQMVSQITSLKNEVRSLKSEVNELHAVIGRSKEEASVGQEIKAMKDSIAELQENQYRIKNKVFGVHFPEQTRNVPHLFVDLPARQENENNTQELTTCVNIRPSAYLDGRSTPLSISSPTQCNTILLMIEPDHILRLYSLGNRAGTKIMQLPLNDWTHVCAVWRSSKVYRTQAKIYINGKYTGIHQSFLPPLKLCGCDNCACKLKVTVGNDVDPVKGGCEVNRRLKEGFVGSVRDVYLWNRALEIDQLNRHMNDVNNNQLHISPKDSLMTWEDFVRKSVLDEQ